MQAPPVWIPWVLTVVQILFAGLTFFVVRKYYKDHLAVQKDVKDIQLDVRRIQREVLATQQRAFALSQEVALDNIKKGKHEATELLDKACADAVECAGRFAKGSAFEPMKTSFDPVMTSLKEFEQRMLGGNHRDVEACLGVLRDAITTFMTPETDLMRGYVEIDDATKAVQAAWRTSLTTLYNSIMNHTPQQEDE